MEDLYAELGVPKTATAEQIKKAFKKLAIQYHPDKNPGDAESEEKFKRINAAYSVLGDETKRRQYDMYGTSDAHSSTNTSSSGYGYGNYGSYEGSYGPYGTGSFWEWFSNQTQENGGSQEETTQRQYYTYTNTNQKNYTRKQALHLLLRSVLLLLALMFFGKILLFIIPIGPILGFLALTKSILGIFQGLKYLVMPKGEDT